MSESFDLRCLTCNLDAGLDWNHGGEELAALWQKRDVIATIATFRLDGIDIEVKHWRGDLPVQFFAAHRDHNVKPWSEYGRAFGACWKEIVCGECKHTDRCRRESGHDGECGRTAELAKIA